MRAVGGVFTNHKVSGLICRSFAIGRLYTEHSVSWHDFGSMSSGAESYSSRAVPCPRCETALSHTKRTFMSNCFNMENHLDDMRSHSTICIKRMRVAAVCRGPPYPRTAVCAPVGPHLFHFPFFYFLPNSLLCCSCRQLPSGVTCLCSGCIRRDTTQATGSAAHAVGVEAGAGRGAAQKGKG